MGQFAGQPDFATRAVSITKSDTIDNTTFLDGAAIFVGAGGNLNVIMAGTVGAATVTGFSSPGYSGSNGSGYVTAAGVATTTDGSGVGLTVDITGAGSAGQNAVVNIVVNAAGSGYKNGDLITVNQGGSDVNAVFRVVAENARPVVGDGVLFSNIADASFVPIIVDYVLSTDTSAGKFVAVY